MDWFDKALPLWQNGDGYITISKKLGLSIKTVQSRFTRAIKRGEICRNNQPKINSCNSQTININEDASQVSEVQFTISDENQLKNTEYLLKLHKYDISKWDIVNAKNSKWNTQIKGGEIETLYASKITVKPKVNAVTIQDIAKQLNSLIANPKPIIQPMLRYKQNGKMLEVNIADLHLGKLSWNGETGENYDCKIAEQRFTSIIADIMEKTNNMKFEKVLFVWTNDFFNSDGISNSTTAGTQQDNDVRWQKLYLLGLSMLVQAVDTLTTIAPVHTFYVGSNHAKQVEFYALVHLHGYFRHNKNVIVDLDCKSRYYFQFGKVLIGFAHGADEKKERLKSLMPIECPQMWANTSYREYHLAHLHSEQVFEEGGIVFRYLPSTVSADAYHYQNCFVGAFKRSYSFIWDKENGLENMIVSYVN